MVPLGTLPLLQALKLSIGVQVNSNVIFDVLNADDIDVVAALAFLAWDVLITFSDEVNFFRIFVNNVLNFIIRFG